MTKRLSVTEWEWLTGDPGERRADARSDVAITSVTKDVTKRTPPSSNPIPGPARPVVLTARQSISRCQKEMAG